MSNENNFKNRSCYNKGGDHIYYSNTPILGRFTAKPLSPKPRASPKRPSLPNQRRASPNQRRASPEQPLRVPSIDTHAFQKNSPEQRELTRILDKLKAMTPTDRQDIWDRVLSKMLKLNAIRVVNEVWTSAFIASEGKNLLALKGKKLDWLKENVNVKSGQNVNYTFTRTGGPKVGDVGTNVTWGELYKFVHSSYMNAVDAGLVIDRKL